jgi:hypothetical protein
MPAAAKLVEELRGRVGPHTHRPLLRHRQFSTCAVIAHLFLDGADWRARDALAGTRQRRSGHEPGRVFCDLAVMLADGGRCVSDLAALAGQAWLFGEVASVSTARRVVLSVSEQELERSARRERRLVRERGLRALRLFLRSRLRRSCHVRPGRVAFAAVAPTPARPVTRCVRRSAPLPVADVARAVSLGKGERMDAEALVVIPPLRLMFDGRYGCSLLHHEPALANWSPGGVANTGLDRQ